MTARVPYVGVAFFVWVGIFNISLVAQFWSFANDLYTKESGARLFPLIVIGMTAGAPLGSLVAGRLFHSGLAPELILQVSAVLLAVSGALYLVVNARQAAQGTAAQEALPGRSGFALVLANPYLRLIAALIVLLNVVNTTGEYLVARLLSAEVQELAALNPLFDKQAYIGAFTGTYQFWVGVTAFLIQAFVTSRLVRYRGLAGVLFALPLIALGGYAIVAAGAGFALVRWVKTAENATDYSLMNTARQMLWLPTTRQEKYKAKQAIDTFFVRGGDVLSAAVVYGGTHMLHLTVAQFAVANIALTLLWMGLAFMIARPEWAAPVARRRWVAVAAAMAFAIAPSQASGQTAAAPVAESTAGETTRQEELAARQAEKAGQLRPYTPDALERNLMRAERMMFSTRPVYAFIGSTYEGGGLAVGPGYRRTYGDSGTINAYAAVSVKNYRAAELSVGLPEIGRGRLTIRLNGRYLDAPEVAFYGATEDDERTFEYTTANAGAVARVQASKQVAFGGGFDLVTADAGSPFGTAAPRVDPTYGQTRAFVEFDTRTHAGLHRDRRLLPPRLHRLPRDRQRALHVPARGCRRAAVHPDSARQLGDRAARPRLDDDDRRRQRGAVLPAARARRPHAARLPVVALPRPQPRAAHRRIPLGRGPVRGHGGLRGRRHGRAPVRRARPGPAAHVTRRRPHVPHAAPDCVPHGSGALQRRSRAGVLLQPAFLTLAFESRGSRS